VQHALLSAINTVNAFDHLGSYANISLEDVVAADLDVIILSRKVDYDEIMSSDEWAEIPAVANGRVYFAPKGMNGMIAVAPELAIGIPWAASCVYPELMEGFDLETTIKEFYHDFLNYDLSDELLARIIAGTY